VILSGSSASRPSAGLVQKEWMFRQLFSSIPKVVANARVGRPLPFWVEQNLHCHLGSGCNDRPCYRDLRYPLIPFPLRFGERSLQ
jgi:hypothetical protein